MQKLIKYLTEQKIQFKINREKRLVKINNETFYYPEYESGVFTEELELKVTQRSDTDYYIYLFGGRWYYTSNLDKPEFNELKYLGKSTSQTEIRLPFLGIHGAYEVLNGSREYKDWVNKAKFLGINTLAILEKNTLAGALRFQLACKSEGIKSIIGATYTIYRLKSDLRYDIKLLVKNKTGWTNLLKINKLVNIDNNGYIDESKLLSHLSGIIPILDPKSLLYGDVFPLDFNETFMYYQFDTVEYESDTRGQDYLLNLQKYYNSKMKPVFIADAYYLDKEDKVAKYVLNQISENREHEAHNQYFKDVDDYFQELFELFEDENKAYGVFEQSTNNLLTIADQCAFEIETGKKHLPKYIMNNQEKEVSKTNEDLYWHYIEQGVKEKGLKKQVYFDRIEKEYEIINHGHLQDYFLINRDQMKWAESNNILAGIGRGSAPSFTTTWIMGITKLDPIKYKLIPERFLTKERAVGKIADIDSDFMIERRDDVKTYLKEKYGQTQCCSVGTLGALKLKGIITDIGKIAGVEYGTLKIITKYIPNDVKSLSDLFYFATKRKAVKDFILHNPEIFYIFPLVLNSFRSKGVHASAFIITPKEKQVFEWFPTRIEDGEFVSEWDGYVLEDVGMLKQDILGLTELSKIQNIVTNVKENKGIDVNIFNIPLNNRKVYEYLSKGYAEDVFQFGTSGLKGYNVELKPNNINDLIAAVALYRPGTMENNIHNEYILRKEGKKEVEYMWGTQDILKDTYGLPIYQENVMAICQIVGGFTASESDEIRRAMGKKKTDLINKYEELFIDGAIKNSCPKIEAKEIWNVLKEFSKYSFNLSHSASYAITGYISQWLKVNYPLEFWATAFKFAKEERIPNFISEIYKTGDIKLYPIYINKSKTDTYADHETNSIYWSISSVKQVGEKATEQIIKDRNENGQYFSFEEFYERHKFKGSKVTKQIIENLILSGAFDHIENTKEPQERLKTIELYRNLSKPKINPEKDLFVLNKDKLEFSWWWVLQQKLLSGIAFFDFVSIVEEVAESNYPYLPADEIQLKLNEGKKCTIAGYISEFERRQSKKGEFVKIVLESNYEFLHATIWTKDLNRINEYLVAEEKALLVISGKVAFDKYKKQNVLFSDSNTDILTLF